MKTQMILIGMLSFVMIACKPSSEAISPDGNVRIGVQVTGNGQLNYSVTYKGNSIIQDALLGLVLEDGDTLGNHLKITGIESRMIDETYPVYAGKCDRVHNNCAEIAVALEEKQSGRMYSVILRAYDDGVAFRYVVPNQPSIHNYNVSGELTQFSLGGERRIWMQTITKFYKNHYEHPYQSMILDSVPSGTRIQLPLVLQGNNFAGAISEAELKDYAGLYLEKGIKSDNVILAATLSRINDEDIPVRQTDSIITPWRLVMLADRGVDLIKSNLVYNLSKPCKIESPDWIKSGKVAWDWWNDQQAVGHPFEKGMNNATMKYFIDFASETGLEYMLIDAGWGVKGLKIDYMDGDLQHIVDFYYKTAACAANNRLLVDFHGSCKPTGLNRTFPNVMSYEGVLGLEHCKWSKRITPRHNVTIPFTRILVGPIVISSHFCI